MAFPLYSNFTPFSNLNFLKVFYEKSFNVVWSCVSLKIVIRVMVFSLEQRIFIVEFYFKTLSCNDVRNLFSNKYGTVNPPSNDTIWNVVRKFKETGSVKNREKNRTKSVLNEDCIQEIRDKIIDDPHTSIRKLSSQMNISYGSTRNALRKTLQYHPYKINVIQELKPADYPKRLNYSNWFLSFFERYKEILDLVFFSDEAYFHLSGYVNSQNFRTWAPENPHQFVESPLFPQKIGVWCAVSRRRIIGPFFFHRIIKFRSVPRHFDAFWVPIRRN